LARRGLRSARRLPIARAEGPLVLRRISGAPSTLLTSHEFVMGCRRHAVERKRLVSVAVGYALVVAGFFGVGLYDHYASATPPTGAPPSSTAHPCTPGAPPPGGAVATLAPRGSPVDSIAFGRGLGTQVREFEFTVADERLATARCLPMQVNPFLRVDDGDSAQLDPQRIGAEAKVIGRQVLVTVAVMRTDARFAPSGTYSGTVSIVDPRIERVDIPLTMTLAYPVWQLPLVVLLLTVPVAVGYLWLLKGSFHGGRPDADVKISLGQFDDYAFSRNGILAIGAGTASAVLVFAATYLRAPTWGSSFVDAISLFGAMFAAFAAASTPVTAAGTDRYDPLAVNGTSGPQRADPPSSTATTTPAGPPPGPSPALRAAPAPRAEISS